MSESAKLENVALNLAKSSPYTLYQFGILQTLVTQDWVGIYFSAGLFLFGDLLNGAILKPLCKAAFPNVEIFKRPKGNGDGTGCGIYTTCKYNGKPTHGFPSGHSQMLAIFAAFWISYMFQYLDQTAAFYISVVIILLLAVLIMASRIYIGCHNLFQVVVGASIGTGLGYLLFYIYTLLK